MSLFLGALAGAGEAAQQIGMQNSKVLAEDELLRHREELDTQKSIAIEQAKQALKLSRQSAALGMSGGAAPSGGIVAQTQGDTAPVVSTDSGAQVGQSVAQQLANTDAAAWDLPGLAKQYNLPLAALRNLAAAEDFKGIGEMIAKKAEGKKQIVNGVLVDLDTAPPGVQPGITTSANGNTTYVKRGPNGEPVVSVPAGALEAQAAQQGVAAGVKAATTPIKVFNPSTQREEYSTEAKVIGNTSEAGLRTQVQGGMGPDPAAAKREIAAVKKDLGNTTLDPSSRKLLQAHLTDMEAQLAAIPSQASGNAAGPSIAEQNKAAAGKEYDVQSAKDVVEQRKSIMNAGLNAPGNIARYQKLGQLLQDVDGGRLTPTGTEIASALNSVGIKVDKGLGNKQAAAAMANEMALQLRSPQGGAGMPGALSDKDREFLVSMTPSMTQSLDGRTKIIQARIAVEQRNQDVAQFARNYEKKNGRLDNNFFDQLQAWSGDHPLFKVQ